MNVVYVEFAEFAEFDEINGAWIRDHLFIRSSIE